MRMGRNKGGFSLIEVSLAIFVIASGMLILFSLFPVGLRQLETAQTSTQEALFADYLLSSLRAEAMKLTSSDWGEIQSFQNIVQGITGRGDLDENEIFAIRYQSQLVSPDAFLGDSGEGLMRYVLSISGSGGSRTVRLWCQSGQYGPADESDFKRDATKFYTELFYSGMP